MTQAEGWILGLGAKIFTIAGPVIVYGISASVVYGLIYWITLQFQRKAHSVDLTEWAVCFHIDKALFL